MNVHDVGPGSKAWRAPSLRGRVALLAGTVVVLLSATLFILLRMLSSSQASFIAQSNKHLETVARSLAEAYEGRSDHSLSLAEVTPLPVPPRPGVLPPPPPPVPPPTTFPPAPVPRPPDTSQSALALLASQVLQNETGIEGGYFRSQDQHLVGYAFPTHEGPGDLKALPARETPTIIRLASSAASQAKLQRDYFYGARDIVLFIAVPVCENKGCRQPPIGAAWLMQRIPGVEQDRKQAALWSAVAFGAVTCAILILAFLLLAQVNQGTQAILNRLSRMESDLSSDQQRWHVGLAEFHRVMDGLDRLGNTLHTQFEKERELQNRLRQGERLAAIGRLAAGVAHELRNPLATIRLRTQMAIRRTPDEPLQQAAQVVLAEVDRLDTMIERLLHFSRPIRLHRAEVNLSLLAVGGVDRWQGRQPDILFMFHGDKSVFVDTDGERLQQVLDNVVENAVHQLIETKTASPRIDIECRQDKDQVLLEVRDNGGGFTPEALCNALEPFFTTRAQGTGLGLSIAHETVQALGGTLHLQNTADGASVSVRWNRGDQEVDAR